MIPTWFDRVRRRGPIWLLPVLIVVASLRYVRRICVGWKWKLLGISVAHRCHIGPGLRSTDPQHVRIGTGVIIGENVRFASETLTGRLSLGEGVEIGRGSVLDHAADLTLEPNVLVSENVTIYTHDHGYDPRAKPTATPLVLGKGCWIGAHAIILPCVNFIGAGAIVGAGAVVCEDIQAGHVYVGPRGRQFERKDLQGGI